jgi:hypothetical protein
VYASWNGATTVGSWRVLAGAGRTAMHQVTTQPTLGFETQIAIPAAAFVAVQALDADGRVLSTTATIAPS